MNNTFRAVLSASLIVVAASSLHAQILWGSATNIAGPGDIMTLGSSYVSAITASSSGSNQTVGDTVFHRTADDGTLSFQNAAYIGSDGTASPTPSSAPADAAAYNLSLVGCAYQNVGNTALIVLGSNANPLTIGSTYQVQLWDSVRGAGRTITLTDGNSVVLNANNQGQFVVGTFMAASTTETISFASTDAHQEYAEVNDVALRLVTTPEPSTSALMLGGAGLLALVLRRKGAAIL